MNLDMQVKRGLLALALIAGTGAMALTAPKPVCHYAQDKPQRSFIVSPAQIHPLVVIDALGKVRAQLEAKRAEMIAAHRDAEDDDVSTSL